MILWRMAFRNILRSRRRSLITGLAMAFALGVMIAYSGLMDGMIVGMKQSMIGLEIGNLQIYKDDYRQSPNLYKRLDNPEALVEKIKDKGYKASYRLYASALAAFGNNSAGVQLRGVDPILESETTDLPGHMAKGKWLDPTDAKGVVIGRRLARSLGVTIGDELVLVAQAADGSLANDLFTVRGILKTVGEATDRSALFIPAKTFRELMVMESGAHQMIVRLTPEQNVEVAKVDVVDLVKHEKGVEVLTWSEARPALAEMLATSEAFLIPTLVLVYIAIAIVILNAMLMAVFERIHEYGVMKALGVGPGSVFALVTMETGILTTLAGVVGLGVGVPLLFYLENHGIDLQGIAQSATFSGMAIDPIWRSVPSVKAIVAPLAMLYVMTALATIYPAWKAARLDPIEAIQHQ